MSLPSRGAWIEMDMAQDMLVNGSGRSPRGGRGLKFTLSGQTEGENASLPSRGAWIEIRRRAGQRLKRKRRSPRGGRGLKFAYDVNKPQLRIVAPLAGGVD